MRKILFLVIAVVFGLIVCLGACGSPISTYIKQDVASMNESVKDKIFEVTVNGATVVEGMQINYMTTLPKEDGIKYTIINVTFKNIDDESRYIGEGDLIINDNEKIYKFDNSETIMADGWGLFLDQLSPLASVTTNIVYRIPKKIQGDAYYIPGRGEAKFYLGKIGN